MPGIAVRMCSATPGAITGADHRDADRDAFGQAPGQSRINHAHDAFRPLRIFGVRLQPPSRHVPALSRRLEPAITQQKIGHDRSVVDTTSALAGHAIANAGAF